MWREPMLNEILLKVEAFTLKGVRNLMGKAQKLKQASLLWLEGFTEACCLHRVIIYCLRSKELAIRTGQCFLLNGFIFLGRYNDIAKYGFFPFEKYQTSGSRSSDQKDTRDSLTKANSDSATDIEGVMIGIAEQIYSILLLSFFFLQVFVTGFVPYIGKALNFLLLSWMYAYYCFEYKWNYSGLSLDKRLDFFESNWPFFAGFGSPCVLAVFFYSPLVSYGVMAMLYPLFVLTATGSEADKVIASQRKKWKGAGLGRVPIFVSADYLSLKVLSLIPIEHHPQKMHNQ